ncbi:hypothetical protein JCM8097_008613 [Rhodosporidiobolus ruineniae]
MDSSESPDQIDSSPPPDRLSRLPAELLERIFFYLKEATASTTATYFYPPRALPHRGPICKTLLPFQRRTHTHIRIWHERNGQDVHHLLQLLSQCDNLKKLGLDALPDLANLLMLLPQPCRLQELVIGLWYNANPTISVDTAFAASLARFTSLDRLDINCPCDLSSFALRQALRSTSLRSLTLGDKRGVVSTDLLKLVEGDEALPFLKVLIVKFVWGTRGKYPEDLDTDSEGSDYGVGRIMESWTMPDWPVGFSEDDMRRIVAAGEARGVQVTGWAVEAIGIIAEYREALYEAGYEEDAYGRERPQDLDEEEEEEEEHEP